MNETILTIAFILIFIAGPFWLIKQIEKKDPIFKDRGFLQIRGVLRKTLLPLGFVENQTHIPGSMVTYQRERVLVELFFDYREKEYSFFATNDVQDPGSPPRQVSIIFSAAQFNSEKKKEISAALHEWIETIQ